MSFDNKAKFFLCLISLFFLIGFTAHCISQNVNKGDEVFKELVNATYDLSWADERMIRNQQLYTSNPDLMQSDVSSGLAALSGFIKTFSEAGQLISKPLFCKMLQLDMQNNAILNVDGTININKLMTSSEQWANKRNLLDIIWKEQASYHSFFSGIGTLFGDAMANQYTRTDCQGVDTIPTK